MTLRLTIGIDPGQSGAFAMLADGNCAGFIDMPTRARRSGSGNEVDGATLAAALRGVLQKHPGAAVFAALEQVKAMPSRGAPGEERRTMGATSAIHFGESFGVVRGVLETLGIGYELIWPETWKRKLGLIKKEKDVARSMAIQRFPDAAIDLQRKKDIGRADALLIAHYAERAELVAKAA